MATAVAVNGTPTFRERFEKLKTIDQRKDDLIEVCFFLDACSSSGVKDPNRGTTDNTVNVGTCTRG